MTQRQTLEVLARHSGQLETNAAKIVADGRREDAKNSGTEFDYVSEYKAAMLGARALMEMMQRAGLSVPTDEDVAVLHEFYKLYEEVVGSPEGDK